MILEIILGVSIFFNVMLVWYIYKLLKNLLDIEDQFLEMKTKLIEFATHLKGINKVESFYGDPTITALIEHMKKLSADIEEYSKIMVVYEDDMEDLDDNEKGQTSFSQYGFKSPCKKGSLLVFPPLWPWLHAGDKPINKPKYIVGSYLHYVNDTKYVPLTQRTK